MTPTLLGTLRLATKYQVDALRSRIVRHFEADWPRTLAEWDRLESEIDSMMEEHQDEKNLEDFNQVDGLFLDERLPEPAAAIRLAIEFGIPSILPAAFYTLARTTPDWHWGGHDTIAENDLDRSI